MKSIERKFFIHVLFEDKEFVDKKYFKAYIRYQVCTHCVYAVMICCGHERLLDFSFMFLLGTTFGIIIQSLLLFVIVYDLLCQNTDPLKKDFADKTNRDQRRSANQAPKNTDRLIDKQT